jgi:Icc-related predicted phosphoesterase
MRAWIFSDLHVDVCPYRFPDPRPDHDVVIIAGDIGERVARSIKWIANSGFTKPVIFVPGNHEFYHDTIDHGLDKAREEAAKHPNIHLLDENTVDIMGVRFIGATLWTDYCLMRRDNQYGAMDWASQSMNDHRFIRMANADFKRFMPANALVKHEAALAYINAGLDERPAGMPTVVVTHHAPSIRSVPAQFFGQLLNAAFASHLDHYVDRAGVWVHGHIHTCQDYRIGDGRVICNPRGYVAVRAGAERAENAAFDPTLVVDITKALRAPERQGNVDIDALA